MTTLQQEDDFEFQFSLQILNHLGRGLYRSFATVIAEAVSNAWDADAREVDIRITSNSLVVEDDGKGMNATDFQRKFLFLS
jgi:nitrate/nitrite-specific signal transduction histidine kinase